MDGYVKVMEYLQKYTGRCSCDAVHVVAQGPPDRVGVCHCKDCQLHHGALFYAAAIYPKAAVVVSGETICHAGRHSCAKCGSSVFAQSGAEVEVHLGIIDDATTLVPSYECWTRNRAAWLKPIAGAAQYERGRTSD